MSSVKSSTCPSPPTSTPRSGGARPRSKTFEEYEKETDDAWDDREDLTDLSLPKELEFPKPGSQSEEGVAQEGRGRTNSRGKSGKSEPLREKESW